MAQTVLGCVITKQQLFDSLTNINESRFIKLCKLTEVKDAVDVPTASVFWVADVLYGYLADYAEGVRDAVGHLKDDIVENVKSGEMSVLTITDGRIISVGKIQGSVQKPGFDIEENKPKSYAPRFFSILTINISTMIEENLKRVYLNGR